MVADRGQGGCVPQSSGEHWGEGDYGPVCGDGQVTSCHLHPIEIMRDLRRPGVEDYPTAETLRHAERKLLSSTVEAPFGAWIVSRDERN